MSYYATIDDKADTGGDVATISGWAEFGQWVQGFKPPRPEMLQIVYHGLSEHLDALAAELKSAIADESPNADVADIAQNLADMIASVDDKKAVLTISN